MIEHYLPHGGKNNNPHTIVIHAMAEYVKTDSGVLYAPDFLDSVKLSAHALAIPTGDIIRCRRDNETAWHAKGHNQDTLGIEILVQGVYDYSSFLKAIKTQYITSWQWEAVLEQCREWMGLHDIKTITTHHLLDPYRKQDPGTGFDLGRFMQEL